MSILPIVFVSIVLALTPDDAANRPTSTADSIRVLLFASWAPSTCTVAKPRSPRASVVLTHGSMSLNGRVVDEISFHANGGELLTISIGRSLRRVRGTVVVRPAEDRLAITATLSVEDYLAGALAAESYGTDPLEYLIALSVLQRNFIATHRNRHAPLADVCDNTHCQRTDMGSAAPRQRSAVKQGRAIQLQGSPCYYSVNCGGTTLTPQQVWGRAEAGYSSVRCTYCAASRWRHWGRTIPSSPEVDRLLASRRTLPCVDDELKIAIGRIVGFGRVPGNTFDRVERRGRVWRIVGRGFGHRVGLCQEGALRLARMGRTARAILAFYFPVRTETR